MIKLNKDRKTYTVSYKGFIIADSIRSRRAAETLLARTKLVFHP